jgi:hypothetical protein
MNGRRDGGLLLGTFFMVLRANLPLKGKKHVCLAVRS